MRKVPGLGAKKLRLLYLENGIDSLEALELGGGRRQS